MAHFTRPNSSARISQLELRNGNKINLRLHIGPQRPAPTPSITSSGPNFVSVLRTSLNNGPQGIWSVRLEAKQLTTANVSVAINVSNIGSATGLRLPVTVVAPHSIPAANTREGLWTRLGLSECYSPGKSSVYSLSEVTTATQWFRLVIVNRLNNNPTQFLAPGARTVFDIVKGRNQVAGFGNYPTLDAGTQKRIDDLVAWANDDNRRNRKAYEDHLLAIKAVAMANSIVANPSTHLLAAWRTTKASSPGPRFAFYATKSGNDFYELP